MNTETVRDDVRLHHSIAETGAAPSEVANDFEAGFRDGDAPADPAPPAEVVPAAGVVADGGEPQGVDIPENGQQVPPQPQELDLSGLPDEVRQHIETIQAAKQRLEEENAQKTRDFDALHSRVAPVQRKLDAAERELASRPASAAPHQQPQPNAPAQLAAAVQAQFETPEWKEYERLYPDDAAIQKRNQLALAQGMDAHIGRLESVVGQQIDRINRLDQARMSDAKRAEIDELSKAHPDWNELNESDEFWGWFNQQPALTSSDERVLRQRLNDKTFVINALDLYKASNRPPAVTPPAASTPPADTNTGVVSQPDVTLTLASAPRNTGAGVRRPAGGADSPGSDFLAGFNDPS